MRRKVSAASAVTTGMHGQLNALGALLAGVLLSVGLTLANVDAEIFNVWLGDDPTLLGEGIRDANIMQMIRKMYNAKLQGSTINRKLAVLSELIKHAYRLQLITRIPVMDRQEEGVLRLWYLDEAQERDLLDYLGQAEGTGTAARHRLPAAYRCPLERSSAAAL